MNVPGPLVLLGSGETAPNMQRIYTWLFDHFSVPVSVSILETPAGFEPNSAQVAGSVGSYLEKHLVNFRPRVQVVSARRRGAGLHGTDNAVTLAPMTASDVIVAGPGSPSYAVRHLRQSRAWAMMRAHHRQGGGLLFSSAGTLAIGGQTLPIYEIYKVGEDLHWKPGLDLLADFGLDVVLVSHWNNNDGGAALDTSRCYIGSERFERLLALLPPAETRTLVGIDEKTALCVDFAAQRCTVLGAGSVHLQRRGVQTDYANNATFALAELGDLHLPQESDGLDATAWAAVAEGQAQRRWADTAPAPQSVSELVAQREEVRSARDWLESDRLRDEIAALGWQVNDTPDGPVLQPRAQE